jgi:ribose 5-phosphate isomerase RpiB
MSICNCGSGESRRALRDAAGIFCAYVCDACEAEVRKRYNPSIFKQGTRYSWTGEEEDLYIDEEYPIEQIPPRSVPK